MLHYKLALKHPLKTHHLSQFSQVRLPLLHKKLSQQENKLAKIKSGKLPQFHQLDSGQSQYQQKYKNGVTELPHDIERRVNNIMHNGVLNQQYYSCEGQNFQMKVLKQKKLLKIQRKKRESTLSKNMSRDGKEGKSKQSVGKSRTKKKAIDLGKKVASKQRFESPEVKKRGEDNSFRENLKEVQSIDRLGLNPSKMSPTAHHFQKKMSEIKSKLSYRSNNKKFHTDANRIDRSENLFDSIHNYLTNPHKICQQNKVNASKEKINRRRQVLQTQLRNIDSMMPNSRYDPRTETDHGHQITARIHYEEINNSGGSEWRKLQLDHADSKKGNHISISNSTFQHEINRLSSLQQRNEHSLERYLANQRLLYTLQCGNSSSSRQQPRRQHLSK